MGVEIENIRVSAVSVIYTNAILTKDIQSDHHRERTACHALNLAAAERSASSAWEEHRHRQSRLELRPKHLHVLIGVTARWTCRRDRTDLRTRRARRHIEVERVRLAAVRIVHPDPVLPDDVESNHHS